LEESGGSNYINIPNFVAISQTVAKIWHLFQFLKWRPPPCQLCRDMTIFTNVKVKKSEKVRRIEEKWCAEFASYMRRILDFLVQNSDNPRYNITVWSDHNN